MEQRQLPEDFKDFVQLLNINDVEYLLIGEQRVEIKILQMLINWKN